MKKYKVLFASWLMAVALIAPFRVNAQTFPTFVITDSFSGKCHPHPLSGPGFPQCNHTVASKNAFMTAYPLGGSTFPANQSSSCTFTDGHWPTTCNNLQVKFTRSGVPSEQTFCEITYASPTQINFIANYNTAFMLAPIGYIIDVLNDSLGVVSHKIGADQNAFGYSYGVNPMGAYDQGKYCQAADIYDATTGGYIQHAGSCAPFPRTSNDQTTIAQIYLTGIPNPDPNEYRVRIKVNGNLIAECQQVYNIGTPGWFVTNIQPPAGWLPGDNVIETSLYQHAGGCRGLTQGVNEVTPAILFAQQ
jgi:hypothetical protein